MITVLFGLLTFVIGLYVGNKIGKSESDSHDVW
jgi:hypothetical protein